ncbi:short-chain dehydrogenase [Mycobacterium alsense]|uniref:Short-chain dehydrogenase n=1 Tax=Mycobacterium alsense TaxID=324058 RepID=A0ABD6P5H4_9MYCO|nr:SDR family NAD(P)-dependent oxidoreductase [Mycobacterium alsense]OBG41331.1 short-chain dehydrogenase [Mycobacterium alsense]
MGHKWSAVDVPEQRGRVAVITGANTGIGFQTAALLAVRGAHVVLAVRDIDKGRRAACRIRAKVPNADLAVQQLDLSSLDSVHAAADALRVAHRRIHVLINNAGVMFTPERCTKDGFELQFGTNHLGHFALTGLLLERMLSTAGSRVVTVSSLAHRVRAGINFDDLHSHRGYDPVMAYGASKLANLLFSYELQRRLAANGRTTIAVAAHPGSSRTQLSRHSSGWIGFGFRVFGPLLFQSARMGALPILRAAADPTSHGGDYYGPGGIGELRGHPRLVKSSGLSHDERLQRRLWAVSEELTAISYPI